MNQLQGFTVIDANPHAGHKRRPLYAIRKGGCARGDDRGGRKELSTIGEGEPQRHVRYGKAGAKDLSKGGVRRRIRRKLLGAPVEGNYGAGRRWLRAGRPSERTGEKQCDDVETQHDGLRSGVAARR